MDQHARILNYLKTHSGGISPAEAFTELGITKLATRISEMIDQGIGIIKMWEESVDRYGDKTRYRRYYLDARRMDGPVLEKK